MSGVEHENGQEFFARDAARVWVADVIVTPKPGVNDPEGEAIRGGLEALGYAGLRGVRAGRFFQLTVKAPDAETATTEVASMCERLLANPVIETYQVSVTEIVPEREPEGGSR